MLPRFLRFPLLMTWNNDITQKKINLRTMNCNFLLGTSWMAHHKPSCDIWLKTYAAKKNRVNICIFQMSISQWKAALTNFSFSRYFLKKSSFFSTKNFKFVGPALLFFGQKYPIYWYFLGDKIFVEKYLRFVTFWKRIEMFSSKNEHTLIFYF